MEIIIPNTKEIETQTTGLQEQVATLTIETAAQADGAGALIGISKDLQAKVKETFDPLAQKAHELHRMITASRAKHLEPLLKVEQKVKDVIGTYHDAQARIRREEEERQLAAARAIEEARRKEEMAALKKEAEKAAREASSKAEAARIKREAEQANERIKAAPIVIQVIDTPEPEKIAGVTIKKTYGYKIINESLIPRKYYVLDEKLIGREVKALGAKAEIPGVQVIETTQVAAGRR